MTFNILVVNPKDKVTQIAVFENFQLLYINNRRHSAEELSHYKTVYDQVEFRRDVVFKELENNGFDTSGVRFVISRGGLIKPVHSGVYKVNEALRYDLLNSPIGIDIINIGGLVADAVAARIKGANALIAHPTTVDELQDIARITGAPGIERKSVFHALNQKAVARLYAESLKKNYNELNLIVAHMGNGTTVGAHCKGRVIDVNQGFEGDGPLSMIRCGSLPLGEVVKMCVDGEKTKEEIFAMLTHEGGIKAHLGTTNITEIESRIKNNDHQTRLIIEAMAYQVAKSIGEMFVALKGKVDAILLTGDLAHSEFVVNIIRNHVDCLGQVIVFPGDNEIQAMAASALRVIREEIEISEYK